MFITVTYGKKHQASELTISSCYSFVVSMQYNNVTSLLVSPPQVKGRMAVLQILPTAVLLLVCWGALQIQGQQLGNAVSHCSINDC